MGRAKDSVDNSPVLAESPTVAVSSVASASSATMLLRRMARSVQETIGAELQRPHWARHRGECPPQFYESRAFDEGAGRRPRLRARPHTYWTALRRQHVGPVLSRSGHSSSP